MASRFLADRIATRLGYLGMVRWGGLAAGTALAMGLLTNTATDLMPLDVQLDPPAVSARRTQGPRRLSGSNRTIIKHAQQLISNPRHGLGGHEIGERAGAEPALELAGESRRAA